MDAQDIDLHDATLDSVAIAFDKRCVELRVSYYPDGENSAERLPARITFSGVANVADVLDFVALADNRSAGNISYWHPAARSVTSYIYLVSGLVAITAEELRFEHVA